MDTENSTERHDAQERITTTFQTTAAVVDDYVPVGIPGRPAWRAYSGSSGGRSGGGGRRRAGSSKKRTCQDCTHCRWHSGGHCGNPNRRAGRGLR